MPTERKYDLMSRKAEEEAHIIEEKQEIPIDQSVGLTELEQAKRDIIAKREKCIAEMQEWDKRLEEVSKILSSYYQNTVGLTTNQPDSKVLYMPEFGDKAENVPSKDSEPSAAQLVALLPDDVKRQTVDQFLAEILTSSDSKQLANALEITHKMTEITEKQIKAVCGINPEGKIGFRTVWSKYTNKAGEEKIYKTKQFQYKDKDTGKITPLTINKPTGKAR